MNYKRIEDQHIYTITPPKGNKGRWSTYIKQSDGTRKYIAKTKKDDLYKVLETHYKQQNSHERTSINDFFKTWLNRKTIYTNSVETLRRHNQHYLKYYANSKFANIPMSKITKLDIENYIHTTIREFNLSSKELNNMLIILRGCLELAYDLNIINTNPYQNIKINKRLCRYVGKKSNTTQIFFEDEIKLLLETLDKELKETPDCVACLAIKFLFQTGLRVSEVVALKYSDIEDNYIHVRRMEAKNSSYDTNTGTFSKSSYAILEHTKTKNDYGCRQVPLTSTAFDIIEQCKQIRLQYYSGNDDYIFCDTEGRISVKKVAYRLKKCCRLSGIPNKSSHCIRKTVASKLSNSLNINEIRLILGHSNEATTYSYIYNPLNSEDTLKTFFNALNYNDK